MQIVIDIPDEMYDSIKLGMRHTDDVAFVMEQIENNSIILPKKHGRLIDADVLKSKMGDLAGFGILGRCFDDEPTVIDATNDDSFTVKGRK